MNFQSHSIKFSRLEILLRHLYLTEKNDRNKSNVENYDSFLKKQKKTTVSMHNNSLEQNPFMRCEYLTWVTWSSIQQSHNIFGNRKNIVICSIARLLYDDA